MDSTPQFGHGKTQSKSLVEQATDVKSEAHSTIKFNLAHVQSLLDAGAAVDFALQKHLAFRGLDCQAELQVAIQRLAALLESGAGA